MHRVTINLLAFDFFHRETDRYGNRPAEQNACTDTINPLACDLFHRETDRQIGRQAGRDRARDRDRETRWADAAGTNARRLKR